MTQYEKTAPGRAPAQRSCATTFMGINISNPPLRVRSKAAPRRFAPYKKALNHYSTHPLDIQDYINITDFEINPVMFSWFWQIMINGQGQSVF